MLATSCEDDGSTCAPHANSSLTVATSLLAPASESQILRLGPKSVKLRGKSRAGSFPAEAGSCASVHCVRDRDHEKRPRCLKEVMQKTLYSFKVSVCYVQSSWLQCMCIVRDAQFLTRDAHILLEHQCSGEALILQTHTANYQCLIASEYTVHAEPGPHHP